MLAAIVVVAWGMAWGRAARADDVGGAAVAVGGDKPVVEKLLDIMLSSGQISGSQYDSLLEQSREEQRSAATAVAEAVDEAAPPVSEGPTDWTFKWSNAFKLQRSDGAFKLNFGGRIMTDTAFVWLNDGLEADLAALGIDPKDGTGTEFRRARIFFEGTLYERVFFKAQYDFANTGDGKSDFKDVFLGLKKLGFVRDVRVGHFKEPFLLEEWTSSKYITFMERGLNNVFFPGRNVGIMAQGNQLEKKLLWQAGLFYNTNDQGFAFRSPVRRRREEGRASRPGLHPPVPGRGHRHPALCPAPRVASRAGLGRHGELRRQRLRHPEPRAGRRLGSVLGPGGVHGNLGAGRPGLAGLPALGALRLRELFPHG
jgi:phosphate-selective porin OprO/OprP